MTHPLELRNVSVQFGGIKAVTDLTLHLREGEILALIGPNGAGKTTAFNVITGVYTATSGEALCFGTRTCRMKPNEITSLGIARTFQNIRLFKDLNVRDNILIAMDRTTENSILGSLFRTPRMLAAEAEKNRRVDELLKILDLESVPSDVETKNLPYGVQRRLEIARAIATGARVLLLDEPAAGMNGQETARLMEMIRFVRDRFRLSVLLIEHDMRLVMGVSDRVVVLEYGKKIAEGPPQEVQNDPVVLKAYLGTEE